MSLSLGGFICCRNALRLDYCVQIAAESLLPVCDELILCDSDSDDGTTDLLHELARANSRIRVINWPWTDPRGQMHHAWVDWLNFARAHLTTDCQITLDADEVLDDNPLCHLVIRDALKTNSPGRCFDRLNFWRDPRSLIPAGVCCGHLVARMGFADRRMHSDEPHDGQGDWRIVEEAVFHPDLKIFHLGFLRRKEAFYAKARAVQRIWFDKYDARLEEGERAGKGVAETECSFTDQLVPYSGSYPASVRKWLEERGHSTDL